MEAVALALMPPDDSDFVFVSPITEHCPIGGGGGGKGGVFARGKTASFGMSGAATDAEKIAAQSYKHGGYADMNGKLRGEGSTGRLTQITDKIGDMHSLVAKGVAKQAGIVYRGVENVGGSLAGKVGTKVTFKGFTSTSHSESFAKNWVSTGHAPTVFRIYVPKGAHALEYKQLYGHDSMHEVILPHNSTFTVHAASTRPGGGKTVDLILHR